MQHTFRSLEKLGCDIAERICGEWRGRMHCGDVVIPHIESSETFGGVSRVNDRASKGIYHLQGRSPRSAPSRLIEVGELYLTLCFGRL